MPHQIRLTHVLIALGAGLLCTLPAQAARQQVYITGTVQDFGSYTFTPAFSFQIDRPGTQILGTIAVDGAYNGEYPWTMRIYTENTRFGGGVAGTVRRASRAGLISEDGQHTIPLEIHAPNFGPGIWRRVPDLSEEPYSSYQPSSDPERPGDFNDCILMGIDPRNAPWVAGPDGKLFTGDDNLLGDTTLKTPFEIQVRTQVDGRAVKGRYEGLLYIELVPAP